MKIIINTLGCKVNAYESELITENFKNHGDIIVDKIEDADVIVINTCTVTNEADVKSRKIIRQARRKNKNAILVVCGCSAEHNKESLMDLEIDILIGNKNKSKIVDLVESYKDNKERIQEFYDLRHVEFEDMAINRFEGKTRGFVKIQDGCNNFCSYCIIPYMRGNIRSKDIDVATEEINCLANNGYHEIVLTGIHTGSYGAGENYRLVDLIRRISKNPNLKRIRISSIEATELDDDFIEELRVNEKICDHLHIPIQAGSDHVLKLMNRKYKLEDFESIINKIREVRPNISITTDLIAGFPEETDEDFENTLKEVEKINFVKVHTFPFSLRNGTVAEKLVQVDGNVKKARVHKMLELSNKLENEYYKKFLGKTIEVLVEEGNIGLSSNYIKVQLDKEVPVNTFVNVKIIDVDGLNVKGVIE